MQYEPAMGQVNVLLGIAGEQETGPVAEGEGAGTSFDWKSNWYPVFPEIDADKAIPHSFQVNKYLMVNLQCKQIYFGSKIGHVNNKVAVLRCINDRVRCVTLV